MSLFFWRSLRVRLVVMFVVIFGTVLAGLGSLGLLAAERQLREHFDAELIRRTQGMAAELIRSQERMFPESLPRVIDEQTSTIFFRGVYVQLRDGDGQVIERSANLGEFQLPFNFDRIDAQERRQLQTLSGEEVEAIAGGHQKLRMVTERVEAERMPPLILQVATTLQPLDQTVALLRLLFWVALPVGLLAASLAAWWVTGRALRQIETVSEFARRATPDRLGEQLPVPPREDEIGQMIAHVNEMLRRLKTGFDAQERFLHDASHELKTPLATLLSEAQWLKRHDVPADEHRQFVVSVEQEARHLSRLVESLLLLARADSEQVVAQQEVASLNDAVEAAVQECRSLAELSDVQLVVALDIPDAAEGEMMFRGDTELLLTMISNLIRNAIRFSPTGETVKVEVARQGDHGEVLVRDRGPGVPVEAMDRIFERFVQAEPGPRRGSGIGLAIARVVAELHGGRISVANTPGAGCTFTARVPLYMAPVRPEANALQP